jgi:hypothetical protein
MREQFVTAFGSSLVLGGAFAIGAVLHAALVEGTLGLTAPLSVFGLVGGAALVVAGRAVEQRVSDDDTESDESDEAAAERAEYDPELAPVDESALEGYERDDEYDGG